jgi:hypothetical protein
MRREKRCEKFGGSEFGTRRQGTEGLGADGRAQVERVATEDGEIVGGRLL